MADEITNLQERSTSLDKRQLYLNKISEPIGRGDKIVRKPDNSFLEVHYDVANVIATGPLNWEEAYDINKRGTLTTGRRNSLEHFLDEGINPFGTPVNEGLKEVPAVVCGHLEENDVVQDSETFERNYGNIFDRERESEGYVIVLDAGEFKEDECEFVGVEARLKVKVTPKMTKAIIVGHDKMETKVVEELKKRGMTIPVIRLTRTETIR